MEQSAECPQQEDGQRRRQRAAIPNRAITSESFNATTAENNVEERNYHDRRSPNMTNKEKERKIRQDQLRTG